MATITPSVAGGNWSATTAWTGGVVPGAGDDVVFHAGAGNITIDGTAGSPSLCRSLDCNTFSYAGTITQASGKELHVGDSGGGSWTMSAGTTYVPASGSILKFISTTTGNTITAAGKTYQGITFAGASGDWTLQDDFNVATAGTTNTITLTAGTIFTNTHKLTAANFSSTGATIRQVDWSTSTAHSFSIGFTISGSNYTNTQGTSKITCNTATGTYALAGLTFYDFVFGLSSGGAILSGANTFNSLTITGGAFKAGTLSFSASQTVNGAFTCNGNTVTNRVFLLSNTAGTQRTITAATVTVTNTDFQDIIGAGAGNWNLSSVSSGDCDGNSGITFASPQNNYYQTAVSDNFSTTAKWFLGSNGTGGAGRVPLPQDTGFLDAHSVTAGSITVTQDMPRMGSINCTSIGNSPVIAFGTNSFYGNTLTFTSAMSVTGTLTGAGRGTQVLTCGGLTLGAVTENSFGGTLQFADTFASSATLTLTQGTIDASTNNVAVTATALSSSNNNTRTLMLGSGLWTLNGTGTIWNTGTKTSLTISNSTGTIEISDTSASAKTFSSGGITMTGEGIQVNGAASSGAVTFSGAMSIANMAWQANSSIIFTINTTYTVTGLSTTASSGNIATITSTAAGTAATISCANPVSLDWLSIKDNHASGNIPFIAGADSTLVSNFTNWQLSASTNKNFPPFQLWAA